MTKNQFWLPFCGKIKLSNGVVLTGFLTRFEQGKTAFADLRKTPGTQCRCRLGGRPAWAQRNHAFNGAIRYDTIRDAILTCARKPT